MKPPPAIKGRAQCKAPGTGRALRVSGSGASLVVQPEGNPKAMQVFLPLQLRRRSGLQLALGILQRLGFDAGGDLEFLPLLLCELDDEAALRHLLPRAGGDRHGSAGRLHLAVRALKQQHDHPTYDSRHQRPEKIVHGARLRVASASIYPGTTKSP
jgi:hypothetical protein